MMDTKTWRRVLVLTLSSIAVIGIIISIVCWRQSQPNQYVLSVYGVQVPPTVKITSLHKEEGWDGRVCYGTLSTVDKGEQVLPDGIADPNNFMSLTQLSDSRIKNLIEEVNKTFSISKASVSSKSLLYQRITIKDTSLLVIFYDTQSHDLFFYGTRYTPY